ncbi:serine/threonine-protein kinase [Nonomuraea endophytica]|uniref:non-specific serine/threonine protein kinase n=1 Tax=Nonomuraea endophytica TaxID=714136 RepID=A0A7W8AFT6_9ACTN|nr:serine/threonine-protein kinase [Nonomuraea endophytica]MBB5083988.1 putative Ser/Thr protein kinase [Nonomuraea endophytica]
MRAIAASRPGDPQKLGIYQVEGRLGKGGQGLVYLVSGPDGQRLAAKLLNADSWSAERVQRLFLREVALAKQVAGFCTAQVIDAGTLDGQPYLVSEYIDGPSLAEKVGVDGPLSGGDLERLAIGTATALIAIHQAGIVHRDFKPGNVLMGPDGARVIDFGIAREAEATATATSHVLGTPSYIAPEQLSGSPATAASDVFAWGATMAFAATGHAPFGHDSIPAVINRLVHEEPELSGVPMPLRDLVERCLNKSGPSRPSALEVLLTLLGRNQDVPAAVPQQPKRPLRRSLLAALLVGGVLGAFVATRPWGGDLPAADAVAATTQAGAPGPAGSSGSAGTGANVPNPVPPVLTGLTRQAAETRIRQAGWTTGKVTLDCGAGVSVDRVVRTTTGPGVVHLTIGAGSARVPDARGWPLQDGKAALQKAGFTVQIGYRQGHDWIGKIAEVKPRPGAVACKGSTAKIWIGIT